MAFDISRFAVLVDSIGGGNLRMVGYELEPDESPGDVVATDYIPRASRAGLRKGDIILIFNSLGFNTSATVVDIDNDDNATLQFEVAGGGPGHFYDFNYIPFDQIKLIREFDYAAQSEAVVTAGLRAMHDAMMAYELTAGIGQKNVIGHYNGLYACNDELFTEDFAQKLWDMTETFNKFVFLGEGQAIFKVKNWIPGRAKVRTSGFYASNYRNVTAPVPTALFRWEQKSRLAMGPIIRDIQLEGTENVATDPIGFKGREINEMFTENFKCHAFGRTGKWIENINNSREVHSIVTRCGFQPTMYAFSAGGLLSSTVRFSITPGVGVSTVVATESVFTAGDVGKWFYVEKAGVDFGNSNYSHFMSQITGFTNATTVTLGDQAAVAQSSMHGSFSVLTGSIAADSTTLTLDVDPGSNAIDVGDYVMIHKAGSKVYTDLDYLVTRVTAKSGVTLTLATAARETVSNVPIMVAPSYYCGKSDDCVSAAGALIAGNNNDYQCFGLRVEFSFDSVRGSSVPLFTQNMLQAQLYGSKIHGTAPAAGNNFGCNWACGIFDNNKGYSMPDLQVEHGHNHEYAKLIIVGQRNDINLHEMNIGMNIDESDRNAFFYLDPQAANDQNTRVLYSGFNNCNNWPLPGTGQTFARFGTNGVQRQLVSVGPWRQRNLRLYTDMGATPIGKALRGTLATIDDDTSYIIQVPDDDVLTNQGIFYLTAGDKVGCIIGYNSSGTSTKTFEVLGDLTDSFLNTTLSTANVTDTRFGVAINDGEIMLFNRRGAQVQFRYAFMI